MNRRLLLQVVTLLLAVLIIAAATPAVAAPRGAPDLFWTVSGNAGTDPNTNFLGTTDAVALTLRVNNVVGWRLDPSGLETPNVIGGNVINAVLKGVRGGTIGGGGTPGRDNSLPNRICDDFGTVSGGAGNFAGDCSGTTTDKAWATVGGGLHNVAIGLLASVGGGSGNNAQGDYATVAGGNHNHAQANSATIGGGQNNKALDVDATVGGGRANTAGEEADTIGGGVGNLISAAAGTIAGGNRNTVANFFGTVGGGDRNTANGLAATVPGGSENLAGGYYSFASGRRAKANADGTFVFADSSPYDFPANTTNSFRVRATGGVRFVVGIDGNGGTTWSCALAAGSSWSCSSSKALKENFVTSDGQAILKRLSEVPILEWSAIGQDPNVRHLSPMAQDFYAAFGLGEDDEHISTLDLDGVALASIQALYQMAQEKDAEVNRLSDDISTLQAANRSLETRLSALEQSHGIQAPAGLGDWSQWLSVAALLVGAAAFVRRAKA